MPDPHAPDPGPDETQETEQQPTTTVLGDPPARPTARVLPVVILWAAVAFWASGTLVFWTSVYFGTESLRRLASEPTYENPYAGVEAILIPMFAAYIWLPLLVIAMILAVSPDVREGPHPRLASAIAWLVLVPTAVGFILLIAFFAVVPLVNSF